MKMAKQDLASPGEITQSLSCLQRAEMMIKEAYSHLGLTQTTLTSTPSNISSLGQPSNISSLVHRFRPCVPVAQSTGTVNSSPSTQTKQYL